MNHQCIILCWIIDAVCSQVDLAKEIFHEGVERGFYAKVSRLGTQWLELDLHFLSLGGGETALRWWFEECLVPYLGDSKELASVKSIDIVTGYGKTRARGARKGDDGMRKRVRAMLSFMNVGEVEQPNLGRIHIDKEALMKEVERNVGRIIFDARGYEQYKMNEGLDEPYSDAPQFVRPRGGAMHGRDYLPQGDAQHADPSGSNGLVNDRQAPGGNRYRSEEDNHYSNQNDNKHYVKDEGGRHDGYNNSGYKGNNQNSNNHDSNQPRYDNRGAGERDEFNNGRQTFSNNDSTPQSYQSRPDNHTSHERSYPTQSFNKGTNQQQDQWQERDPNSRFESEPPRHVAPPQSNPEADFQSNRDNFNDSSNFKPPSDRNQSFVRNSGDGGFDDGRQGFQSSRPPYSERKRPYDNNYSEDRNYGNRGRQQGNFNNNYREDRTQFNSTNQDDGQYGSNNNYGGRREYGDNSYPNKRQYR